MLYAKTGEKRDDISLFLIDLKSKGITVNSIGDKMGMKNSPTGEIILNNVLVDKTNVIGEINQAKPMLTDGLNRERLILAAGPVAIAGGLLIMS